MLFLQTVIVGFAFMLVLYSIYNRKIPKGLLERIIFILGVIVIIYWAWKY